MPLGTFTLAPGWRIDLTSARALTRTKGCHLGRDGQDRAIHTERRFMTKRYGRNQRRKHREEIAGLKSKLNIARESSEEWQARAARMALGSQEIEDRAFQRFMAASGLLERLLDRMAAEMGRAAGEQYQREISKLRSVSQPVFNVSQSDEASQRVRYVHLRLPALGLYCEITDMDLVDSPPPKTLKGA
jgi:hypothetical protein